MKKLTALSMVICSLSGLNGVNVFGYNSVEIVKDIESINDIILSVNDEIVNKDFIWNKEHNRLMIDSDFIKKYFGAETEVNPDKIVINKNGHSLKFEKDNEFYVMDGLGGRKVGKPEIVNGKMYLPLRCICEAFGSEIKYNQENRTVEIETNAIIMEDSIKDYFKGVQVFDQSTIKITGEKTIYFDPRRIMGEPHDADVIFITHTHNDHYEIDSIKKLIKPSTVVYITKDGVEQALADGLTNVIGVEANKEYNENGIKFNTVSAYNVAEERQNHKKEFNWVGYIAEINGYTYYSAGDTDFIEEMNNINQKIDVAFLPIDNKYNMGAEEAARVANTIKPKVAVPYHYNNFVTEDKAQEFVSFLDKGIKGAIVTFKMQ